jgi:hypothetical protein
MVAKFPRYTLSKFELAERLCPKAAYRDVQVNDRFGRIAVTQRDRFDIFDHMPAIRSK